MSADEERPPSEHQRTKSSYDEIALSAYFIALERARRGEEGDALTDWTEAERIFGLQTGENGGQNAPS